MAVVTVALPATAGADPGKSRDAHVGAELLRAAEADPNATFEVIVQGKGAGAKAVVEAIDAERRQAPGRGAGATRRFQTIPAVAAELTGKQLLRLAKKGEIFSITPDAEMQVVGKPASAPWYKEWPTAAGIGNLHASSLSTQTPTIAIVDSGIAAEREDFRGRVVKQVSMTSLTPNSPSDGRGHGTFVASVAAGGSYTYTMGGMARDAKLVDIDVMDDSGKAMTRDVIAAVDWILANKETYGIRVANFSLQSTVASSFMYDPLCKAVEKLWLSGVVVVVAAGNYAVNGAKSGIKFAPANDPFVITVGALDYKNTTKLGDDIVAPWSAWGHTYDGFAKPDLVAPGRYMRGATGTSATMRAERPDRITDPTAVYQPGYMWMSGTSFAAPVVAGAAAWVLAAHPTWSPDAVKGALMVSTKQPGAVAQGQAGVGSVDTTSAVNVSSPPNPNLGLNRFLVADPAGGAVPVFDAASWASTAQGSASWNSASWNSASWASASWNSASWASHAWQAASWASASWNSTSVADASWNSGAFANLIWVE